MNEADLAALSTQWSNVFAARGRESDAALRARNELLLRYHQAVGRYLRAVLRDEHAVEQVCSNFAVRVLEADRVLQAADPSRGRFRDYLKTILRHMVADYYRDRQRQNKLRERLGREAGSGPGREEENRQFLDCWRQELLDQVVKALAQVEERTGQPYATLMRLQSEHPDWRSARLAEELSARLDRPFSPAGVRQLSHRGRELSGALLVAEAARSLQVDPGDPEGADRVEQEMIDLGLLFSYCARALERYRAGR